MVVLGLPEIALIIPISAAPFHRQGWVYEEKVDGWRIVAYKRGEQVRLMGRRGGRNLSIGMRQGLHEFSVGSAS